jgi:hypothetical protein
VTVYRVSVHHIIDDFVPDKNLDWIRPGLPIAAHDGERLVPVQEAVGRTDAHEPGLVDGRDAVLRRATGDDLRRVYRDLA